MRMCRDLEKKFSAEFSMKIMGSVNHILGMDVVRNSVEYDTVGTREWLANRSGNDELLTTGKYRITNRSRDPGLTSFEDFSTANVSAQPNSTHTKKWKRRYETYIAESETAATTGSLNQLRGFIYSTCNGGDLQASVFSANT
jgi:hypothetical protein